MSGFLLLLIIPTLTLGWFRYQARRQRLEKYLSISAKAISQKTRVEEGF